MLSGELRVVGGILNLLWYRAYVRTLRPVETWTLHIAIHIVNKGAWSAEDLLYVWQSR